MVFEIFGFVTGVAAIGTAWMLMWRHDLFKVLGNFDAAQGNRRRPGNALIWPSR